MRRPAVTETNRAQPAEHRAIAAVTASRLRCVMGPSAALRILNVFPQYNITTVSGPGKLPAGLPRLVHEVMTRRTRKICTGPTP